MQLIKVIVASSAFDFLSKYGFEVINIHDKDEKKPLLHQ